MKLAVIMTVHNRADKTAVCLKSLQKAAKKFFGASHHKLSVYLTDDGSTDETHRIVVNSELRTQVIQGSGELYWNGGMLKAWQEAIKGNYDFYLWLNNDVELFENALALLFDTNRNNTGVVVGATCQTNSKDISYGGRDVHGKLINPGFDREIYFANGNVVLIPRYVCNLIGLLDARYRHGFGDWAYSHRLKEVGFSIKATNKFIGTCDTNPLPDYLNPGKRIADRFRSIRSPKGLPIRESYHFFSSINNPLAAILIILKSRMNLFCPKP